MRNLRWIPRDYEGKRSNPSYWPYSHRNPSKVIFRSPANPVFPRGLTDSQSHVLIFTNVDSWANSHAMIRVVRDLPSNKNGGGFWDKRVYTFCGRTWLVDYRVNRLQWLMIWNLYLGRNELCNRQDFVQNGKWKTIVDKYIYDLPDFNKRILGFLCGIKIWWLNSYMVIE